MASPTKSQLLLARVAVILIVGLAVAGLIVYGLSGEVLSRIWRSILARPGGPMTFRFLLQPVMAGLAAFRDGAADARAGRRAYLSALLGGNGDRAASLWEGVVSTAKILILGVVMDCAYQLIVFDEFFPGEAAIVAVLLAFLPYLLLRGPFERIARHWTGRARGG